jgi:drug/metabolite transporter (DMT)-like permease
VKQQDTRRGILLMLATCVIFSVQDAFSRHLADSYSVFSVVMVRFWFFAAFAITLAVRRNGLRAALRTRFPLVQAARGLLLIAEICVLVFGFIQLGLIATHALFASYPLLVAALSGPVLGETVGWRRWTAVGVGFLGVLVILQPGVAVFSPWAIVPLAAALMFALYSLATRYVSRGDAATTSFVWAGLVGAVAITPPGLWFWQPMAPADWGWMAALCFSAVAAHWLLIKAYEVAEASAIQPFAYAQLVFVSAIGMAVFGETLTPAVAFGTAIVVAAGLFTLWRAKVRGQPGPAAVPLPPAGPRPGL